MKLETILAKCHLKSPEFGRYADYILSEVPDMSLPCLRDLYKHNASLSEYRAHMARIKSGAAMKELP
jgi:hypothetical protein